MGGYFIRYRLVCSSTKVNEYLLDRKITFWVDDSWRATSILFGTFSFQVYYILEPVVVLFSKIKCEFRKSRSVTSTNRRFILFVQLVLSVLKRVLRTVVRGRPSTRTMCRIFQTSWQLHIIWQTGKAGRLGRGQREVLRYLRWVWFKVPLVVNSCLSLAKKVSHYYWKGRMKRTEFREKGMADLLRVTLIVLARRMSMVRPQVSREEIVFKKHINDKW